MGQMRCEVGAIWEARTSRVGIPATGFPVAKARPFTVLTPILNPVKEPGPRAMAHPSISSIWTAGFSQDKFDCPKESFRVGHRDIEEIFGDDFFIFDQAHASTRCGSINAEDFHLFTHHPSPLPSYR